MTAIRRRASCCGADPAVILVALVVGVPVCSLATVGNPIPDEWTWTSPLTTALLGLLACLAWIFWAQLLICEVLRRRHRPRAGSQSPNRLDRAGRVAV